MQQCNTYILVTAFEISPDVFVQCGDWMKTTASEVVA